MTAPYERDRDDDDAAPAGAPADHAVQEWIDHGHSVDETRWESGDRRRAADLQFVHSLLQQTLHPDAAGREQRIVRACTAVRELAATTTPLSPPPRPRRRWLTPLAIAAAVIVVAVLVRDPSTPEQTAIAAVTTSLREAESSSDRRYHILAEAHLPLGGDTTIAADLWVRGARHYVLRQDGPLGDLVVGSDGIEHWITPAVGPVIVGQEPGLLEQLLVGERLATPFLQITSILDRMAQRYELSLLPEDDLPSADGERTIRCTHVLGKKRTEEDPFAPDVIELWTGRQSGVAQRVLLSWNRDAGERGIRTVDFELQPLDEPLPDGWYTHAPHHAADRRVLRRGRAATDAAL